MLKSKRFLSVVMTLAMVLTLCTGMTVTASAYTATGTMTSLWNGGNPSDAVSGTYYSISSKTELENFRNYVNAGKNTSGVTFYLTADITLNDDFDCSAVDPATSGVPSSLTGVTEWIPIAGGATSVSFQGTFDGQEHTIFNIFYNHSDGSYSKGNSVKNNIGLFGKVEENATVKNVSISGGYIGAQRSTGGIAGKNWGTIYNCHNLGTCIYGNQAQGVGGIVGANWVNTTTNPPEVNKCTNAGTVVSEYSKGSAGGIAGENEGQVYNCANTGSVTSPWNAGGIVGSNKNDYNKQTQSGGTIYGGVSNSYNAGSVSGEYAGGIAGYELGSMRNVYNIGNISGTNAGQLIGELASSSARTHENLFYLSGTTAVGVTDSGAGTITTTTFASTTSGKAVLLTALNSWVTNAGTTIYSSWTKSSSINNGYPVFL